MKKLTFTLNVTLLSAILLGTLSVQGMESNLSLTQRAYNQLSRLWTSNTQLATMHAEEYNNNDCALISLPNEKLIDVVSWCLTNTTNQKKEIENSIKGLMRISTTCKHFNTLLTPEVIGKFCENFDTSHKNEIATELGYNYTVQPKLIQPMYILACSGAHKAKKLLLNKAVLDNNIEMIETLLKHNADPTEFYADNEEPIFFHAKTIEIVQMFVDHKVNLAKYDLSNRNVLFHTMRDDSPSELTEFYLEHGVNPKELIPYDGDCLLHELARYAGRIDVVGALEKGKILLDVISDMINTVNNEGQTPLDIAELSSNEAIFELLRDNGGLSAQELTQQAESKNKQQNCIIS